MTEKIIIDAEFIQYEAKATLERELSPTEYEEVYEAVLEDLRGFIQEKIHRVICFNQMLERNHGAENLFPHYLAYHRNINAYQPEFRQVAAFTNEADAKAFIHHDFITEFDEWQTVRVDANEKEQEVYKINC